MVEESLNLILRRLESNPPKITKLELGVALPQCLALGLLRQAEPARALPCPECDGSRLLTIEFIQNKLTKKNHAYIACPECGPVEVSIEQLERWRVDPVAVAKAVLRQLFPALNLPTEILPGRLWRVGKVTLTATIIEHREAESRAPERSGGSLSRLIDDGDGNQIEKGATLTEDQHALRTGVKFRSDEQLQALAADVADLLTELPPEVIDICQRLKRNTVSGVARELGIPQTTLRHLLRRLRPHFEEQEMREYL